MWKYFLYGIEHFLALDLPMAVSVGGMMIVVGVALAATFRVLEITGDRESHDREMDKLRLKQQHEYSIETLKLQRATLVVEHERLRLGR